MCKKLVNPKIFTYKYVNIIFKFKIILNSNRPIAQAFTIIIFYTLVFIFLINNH